MSISNTLFDKLATKIETDYYFLDLKEKIEKKYFYKILKSDKDIFLTDKEFYDLLRYADILSRANNERFHNLSYNIICYMKEFYNTNHYFNIISNIILVNIGNFPAKRLIDKDGESEKDIENKIIEYYKVKNQSTPDGTNVFTDAQFQLFSELIESDYYSFSAPTSFGKSFIIEEFIKYLINKENKKCNIAILVPNRALLKQMANKIREILKEDDEYKIIEYPDIPYIYKNKKFIFVYTPERFISFIENSNIKLNYLFVDEAQKIIDDNDSRSPLYYHSIVLAQKKGIKVYFSSPNIPNTEIFLNLFNKVKKNEMAISENHVIQNKFYIDMESKKTYAFKDGKTPVQVDSKLDLSKGIIHLIQELGEKNQNLIYCNSINETITLAKKFSDNLGVIENEDIKKFIKIIKEEIYEEYFLIDCLKKGVAFHYGKLPQLIREKIENEFVNGNLKYLFCTSTLLEGVNLPAKNIFILSNSIGKSRMSDIDFRNLAGRAGRLKYELMGNVFCVKRTDKSNSWKRIEEDQGLIANTKIKNVNSLILSGKKNFYTNIGNAMLNKKFTNKNATKVQKGNWRKYSNIVKLNYVQNNKSVLLDNFFESNNDKQIMEKLNEKTNLNDAILEQSIDIDLNYQEKILNNEDYILPSEVSEKTCGEVLNKIAEVYNWKDEESKGNNSLYKSEKKFVFLKHIMFDWITGKPIKHIISIMIKYYSKEGYYYNEKGSKESFNKNDRDKINYIINQIIDNLETNIRFKIEKYLRNYYLIMVEKYGVDGAGEDWSKFIEYGTYDKYNMELQKLGLSQKAAKYILTNIQEGYIFENNTLVNIDKKLIMNSIEKTEEDIIKEIENVLS